jgi:hypothetical protein
MLAHGDTQAVTVTAKLGRDLSECVATTGKAGNGFFWDGNEVVAATDLAGQAKSLGVVGDCPPAHAKLLRYGLAWLIKPQITQ